MTPETTNIALKKIYGSMWREMLSGFITPKANQSKYGSVKRFIILKNLPSKEEYDLMVKQRFTFTVADLITDAMEEFLSLGDEMGEWFGNMPEQFQSTDRASQIEETRDVLQNLQEPDVPEGLAALEVFHIPLINQSSRSKRCMEAVSKLHDAITALEDLQTPDLVDDKKIGESAEELADEAEQLISELEQVVAEAEDVNFPTMFG